MQDYDRLDRLAIEKYGSINKLAELLGISSQAIYDWKDKPLSRKKLERLKAIGINSEYIRTGSGEMFLDYKDNGYNPIPRELLPEYKAKPVEYFTDDELNKLKQYLIERDYDLYLLICFIEITACRIDEAIKLTWHQVSAKEIRFIGKTDSGIIIPIHNRLRAALETYNFNPISNQKYNQYLKILCQAATIKL